MARGHELEAEHICAEVLMTELETKLNNILEEHQHESGLHMIGGRRRLIERLAQFFEEDLKQSKKSAQPSLREHYPAGHWLS
jgi:hypothetical protein